METLQITKANALNAFKEADTSGKNLLKGLFGEKTFIPEKITDRIKTFENACEVVGVDAEDYEDVYAPADETALRKLKVIVRALNEGWTPNWNDGNQRKWYPWFYMNKPGFRFGVSYCDFVNALSAGGSRLCFATQELSDYAAKQFLDLYEAFIA